MALVTSPDATSSQKKWEYATADYRFKLDNPNAFLGKKERMFRMLRTPVGYVRVGESWSLRRNVYPDGSFDYAMDDQEWAVSYMGDHKTYSEEPSVSYFEMERELMNQTGEAGWEVFQVDTTTNPRDPDADPVSVLYHLRRSS